MAKVEHYRGLGTDLDKLYQSIKQVIDDEKHLRVVSEYKGTLNDIPLRSIVAVNTSPKVLVGQLRGGLEDDSEKSLKEYMEAKGKASHDIF